MATRLYSLNPGDVLENVTEAAGPATTTKAIELNVDLAVLATAFPNGTADGKLAVVQALIIFEEYIVRGIWPPA